MVPVFVDNLLVVSPSKSENARIKAELRKVLKLRDPGEVNYFLAVLLERDHSKRQIMLSQSRYIEEMLQQYDFAGCGPISTPMDHGVSLSIEHCPKSKEEKEQMHFVPYSHAVGSLMYLAIATRPDIAYAVGVLG
jgi:hypothetical protein